MSEEDWFTIDDPKEMLKFLNGRLSKRKGQLLQTASLRQMERWFSDERIKTALEALEQWADKSVTRLELAAAHQRASDAVEAIEEDPSEQPWFYLQKYAAQAIVEACRQWLNNRHTPSSYAVFLSFHSRIATSHFALAETSTENEFMHQQQAIQARWLRDVMGNPFRRIKARKSWLSWNDSTVLKIAQTIYDDRAFDRLPILADALEDAGCDDADILRHCREPGEHVRGCWVIDLLLGKE